MIRPMPSPSGTNFARYYILQGRRSPSMAYDAALEAGRHGLENEAAASGSMIGRGSGNAKDAIKAIVTWCCENLIDEETYELSELLVKSIAETPLGGQGNASVTAAMDAKELERWSRYGEDFARGFVAASARASANAAAESAYFERFPDARRLEASAKSTAVTGATTASPAIGASAAAEREYFKRFPHAGRLV